MNRQDVMNLEISVLDFEDDSTAQCYVDFVRELFVHDHIDYLPEASRYVIDILGGHLEAVVEGAKHPISCAYIVPFDTNTRCHGFAEVAAYLKTIDPATFDVSGWTYNMRMYTGKL